jgi:two-component sensor histidine kinase
MESETRRASSRSTALRGDNRMVWRVAAGSAVVAIATLVFSELAARSMPAAPPGSLPRMRPPPANVAQLLRDLGVGSLTWYMSLASVPLFFWLARRLPIDRRRWMPAVATILSAVVAMTLLTGVLQYRSSYHGSALAPPLGVFLAVGLLTGALPFITVAAASYAVEARTQAHERALETQRVRAQLAESRLEALSAQLQPHFLFNTLQGISTLIAHDPPAAEEMLANLGELLRELLHRGHRSEIPLRDELRILESYLEIARRRFGDRLTIDVTVDESAADALVPFFILQPLVENALQHGIGSNAGEGSVFISTARAGGRLALTIRDDGRTISTPDTRRGIGLANTRARLAELYGDEALLELARGAFGFEARITLPYRRAPQRGSIA